MFKYLLFIVLFFAEFTHAQTVRTIGADYIDGNNSGFRNYAVNPYMDKNLAGIACTSFATCALTTTERLQGTQSLSLTATSASGLAKLRAKAFDRELYGRNCEFSVDVFTSSSSVPHYDVYLENNGAQVSGTSTAMVQQQNRVQRYTVQAPCGSSTDGPYDLVIDSNATTGTNIKVDNFYAGLNRNIGTDSANYQWTSYTPIFTSMGSQSSINCEHAREGQDLLLRCTYTIGGSPAASEARVSLPGSLLSMSTLPSLSIVGVMTGTAADASSTYVLVEQSVGYVTFGVQASTASGLTKRNGDALVVAGNTYSFFARIPIQGWIVGNVIRMDQSNYAWTSYTPTFTGFGTVTSPTCFHKRDGQDLFVKCRFTTGSHTGVEARVSLPTGITSSSSIATLQIAGNMGSATTGLAGAMYTLIEPSVTYLTLGYSSSGTAAVTKRLGTDWGNTQTFDIFARVQVQGWIENQNAPLLVGGVTSAYNGAYKFEAADINCDASSSITNRTGFLFSVGNRSTTSCALTISSGVFSATPYSCNVTVKSATVQSTSCSCSSATSCIIYGPNADFDAYVSITGPR